MTEGGTDWAGRGRKTVRFRVTRSRSRKRLRVKAKMVTRGSDPTIWGEEWTVRDQAKEQFEVSTLSVISDRTALHLLTYVPEHQRSHESFAYESEHGQSPNPNSPGSSETQRHLPLGSHSSTRPYQRSHHNVERALHPPFRPRLVDDRWNDEEDSLKDRGEPEKEQEPEEYRPTRRRRDLEDGLKNFEGEVQG